MNPEIIPKIVFIGLVIFSVTISIIWVKTHPNGDLHEYLDRVCQGRAWKRSFPTATNNEIRQFLSLFADAFLIKQKQQLHFSPSDQIMGIYRNIYPSRDMPDTMELEIFAMSFKQQYKIDLLPIWRENITLGELFALTRTA